MALDAPKAATEGARMYPESNVCSAIRVRADDLFINYDGDRRIIGQLHAGCHRRAARGRRSHATESSFARDVGRWDTIAEDTAGRQRRVGLHFGSRFQSPEIRDGVHRGDPRTLV